VVGVFALASELQPDDPQSIGPYRLVGQLGQGGMGRVFLGVSPGGRPVAVKAIRAELAANPEFRARFGREVAAARRVSGVFTAQVVDADVDGPVAWMATAYVPGPSLAEAVDTHGPLPDASLLALAAGLAESLNAIHAVGVVHRDLKPSNVLLAEDGPRVIDFGISRATESTMLTQAGLVVGSPGFMSPEQAMGSDVGPPSDIFNLGAVLAFAATGEGPFGTGTTAALLYRVVHGAPDLDRVPPTVRPLIEHCLAKDPQQRPTANGLLAEVGALQPGGTWLPESFTRTYAQGTPSRPSFAWSGPVAAAAAAGAVVAGSNPALAGTASAYAPPAAPPRTPPPPTGPGSDPDRGGRFRTIRPLLPRRSVRAADSGPGWLAVCHVRCADPPPRAARSPTPADGGAIRRPLPRQCRPAWAGRRGGAG
jgi:serine/threonine protein kinase